MPAPQLECPRGERRLLCAALALAFYSTGALAATDSERIAELERKLEQSSKQIQQLSDRLREVEGSKSAAKVAETAPPPAPAAARGRRSGAIPATGGPASLRARSARGSGRTSGRWR